MAKKLTVVPALLKAHIQSYTRKDGAYVKEHDDKRQATAKTPHLGAGAKALRASSKDGDLDHWHNQVAADMMAAGDHKALSRHLKSMDTAARDHVLEHIHPDHHEGLGFTPLNKQRSVDAYNKKFPDKKPAAPTAPETKTNNESFGFHGEAVTAHLRKKHGPEDYYDKASEGDWKEAHQAAAKRFSDTAHHLVQAGHFANHEQARDYLDSTHGRHLHDGATFHNGDVSKVSWLAKDVSHYKKKAGLLKKSVLVVSPDLLKAHVKGYARRDGTFVKDHERQIEAHGVKGMKSTPWRKTFKSQKHFEDWLDKNSGDVEVHGTRDLEQSAKPASSVDIQGDDRYEYANGKKPGGKGSWIFSPHKTHDFGQHGNDAGEHFFQSKADTTYSDAKKQAKDWAASKGHGVIHLQT